VEVVRCIGLACGPVGRRTPGYRVRACDTSLRGNASDSHDRLSNGVKVNSDIGYPPAKLLGGDCTSASEYEAPVTFMRWAASMSSTESPTIYDWEQLTA